MRAKATSTLLSSRPVAIELLGCIPVKAVRLLDLICIVSTCAEEPSSSFTVSEETEKDKSPEMSIKSDKIRLPSLTCSSRKSDVPPAGTSLKL